MRWEDIREMGLMGIGDSLDRGLWGRRRERYEFLGCHPLFLSLPVSVKHPGQAIQEKGRSSGSGTWRG